MKKAFILSGLFVLGLIAWEAQATNLYCTSIININVEDNVPTGYEKINLQGTLMMGTGANDIEAGASGNAVYIHFKRNFGTVSITIYNETGGTVYHTVVNTAVQPTLIIPFSGMNSGSFILSIDNADGYVEGEFEQD